MSICILINFIGFLANNSIAIQRKGFTHNFLVLSDIVRKSDFPIKFVTY